MIVKYFGPMTDITGKQEETIQSETLSELKATILKSYPDSEGVEFSISVNEEIIHEDIALSDSDEIAILPPFAGG